MDDNYYNKLHKSELVRMARLALLCFVSVFVFCMACLLWLLLFTPGVALEAEQGGVCGNVYIDRISQIPDSLPQHELLVQGRELFEQNCKQCHSIHERVVGPQLAHVHQRRSEAWLIRFIKFPEKMVKKEKDPYAIALYREYNQFMPNHDFLSDKQIKSILMYIEYESDQGAVAIAADGE